MRFPYLNLQELNLDWILNKIKSMLRFLPENGKNDQVLTWENGHGEWRTLSNQGIVAIDSVNGKTGTVVLKASDIPLDANLSDVSDVWHLFKVLTGEQGDKDYFDANEIRKLYPVTNNNPNTLYEIGYTYLENAEKIYYPGWLNGSKIADDDVATAESRGNMLHKEYSPSTAEWGDGSWIDGNLRGRGSSVNDAAFPMSCNVFGSAIEFGIPYSQSRMANGTPVMVTDSSGTYPEITDGTNVSMGRYQFYNQNTALGVIPRFQNNKFIGFLRSWEFAQYIDRLGLLKEITTSDYSELRPGDMLFYAATSIPDSGFYKDINHTALFCGFTRNANGVKQLVTLESHPKNTAITTGGGIFYRQLTVGETNNEKLKYFFRYSVPGMPAENIVQGGYPFIVYAQTHAGGGVYFCNRQVTIDSSKLRKRGLYTVVIETEEDIDASGLIINSFLIDVNDNTSTQFPLSGKGGLNKDYVTKLSPTEYAYTFIYCPDGELNGGTAAQLSSADYVHFKMQFYRVPTGFTVNDPIHVKEVRVYNGII